MFQSLPPIWIQTIMFTTNLVSLVVLFLASLSLCAPVPDAHRLNSRYMSDTPSTRRTYSPTRHSRDRYKTLRQFPTSTQASTSHFLPSSASAAPTNKSRTVHHASIDHENPQSPPSLLSAITSSLAKMFNFHQQATPEPTPEPSLTTEVPADNESDTHHVFPSNNHIRENQYPWHSSTNPLETQDHLERAKRLVEDALSQVDASSDEDLSPQELFQMVHLWTRMFKGIEQALTPHETQTSPTPSANVENEVDQEPSLQAPVTQTDNVKEMHRNTLPDIKIALAQAEQLNKQRENERQQKLEELENGQTNDPDYTEGLPKSAPSYPTRLRLQMEARREQWPSVR